jgi:hypothetical protein
MERWTEQESWPLIDDFKVEEVKEVKEVEP